MNKVKNWLLLFVFLLTGCASGEIAVLPDEVLATTTLSPAIPVMESTPTFFATPSVQVTPAFTLTPSITPTATLSAEMQDILAGYERYTSFTLYDDFETPGDTLDAARWAVVPADAYTAALENGALTVTRISKWGYDPISFELLPQNFPQDFNALGVEVSLLDEQTENILTGLESILTDGVTDYNFYCEVGYFKQFTQIYCNGGRGSLNSFEMRIPWYIAHTVQMEWLPETAQMLVFHNGQLLKVMQVEAAAPLQAKSARLYVLQTNPFAAGKVQFDNLSLGSRRASDREAPGDLIPPLSQEVIASTYNLDFVLYDDFSHPLYENTYSQHNWEFEGEPPFMLVQKNGVLTFGGLSHTKGVKFRRAPEEAAAVQIELLPAEGDASVAVAFDLGSRKFGENNLFDYHCSMYQQESGDSVSCTYQGHSPYASNGIFEQYSNSFPLFPGVSNTLTMVYDEQESTFYALLNEILFDKIYVSEYDHNTILAYGLAPTLGLESSVMQAVAVDNVAVGVPREEPEALPSPTAPAIVASLPHSDLYVLDNFDDPKFDSIFNIAAWEVLSPGRDDIMPLRIVQQDGKLSRDLLGGKEGHVFVNQFKPFLPNQVNAFQIDIAPDVSDVSDEMAVNFLFADVDNRNGDINEIVYECILVYYEDGGDRARFSCRLCYPGDRGCDEHTYGWVEVPFGPHTVAIEVEPETHTFYGYLDGEQVDSILLPMRDLDNYQLDMQVYGSEPRGRLYFDNAMLGVPAEHPELLATPAEPYPIVYPYGEQP